MKKRKILFFANTDWYLFNFRLSLAEELRNKGWEVLLVSPPGPYGERLREKGFQWLSMPFSTRSFNPFTELCVLKKLFAIYGREKPEFAHHFTIKCVIYGSIVSKLIGGINVVNSVTGLGHIFTDRGIKAKTFRPLIKLLYKLVLKGSNVKTIFQNIDDQECFKKWGLISSQSSYLIRGSGVDIQKFKSSIRYKDDQSIVRILFASRLLREKGLFELIEAFKIIRLKNKNVELRIAGDIYPENPSSLTTEEVERFEDIQGVSFLGHVDDMFFLLDASDIVILPSYREGTPRILLEAAAMSKPIIATDIAGCRGLVVDDENGILVKVKDVGMLVNAIERLVGDPELRVRFGKVGREIVSNNFEEKIVIKKTQEVYEMF